MTSLLQIGLMLMAVTIVLMLVHPADADDDVKRKRVIIKIPHRVKHIYHHHTKKIHIKKKTKPKPKKKKPHKHVHVVVEEEEIVHPMKSWKSLKNSYKGGWDDWKGTPSGFKPSLKYPEEFDGSDSEHMEEDFTFEDDHDSRESRTYGRGFSYKGKRGKKSKPNSSFKSYEDPTYEGSYEIYHHHDSERDSDRERPRRKPKNKSAIASGSKNKGRGYTNRSSNRKPKSRPYVEEKLQQQEDYDEMYDRGPIWPERKEHPSWHHGTKDEAASESKIRSLPKVPEVNEFIDDVNDNPDPATTYGNSEGFYPSAYNPITTITASVVQKSPPQIASGINNGYGPKEHYKAPHGHQEHQKPPHGYGRQELHKPAAPLQPSATLSPLKPFSPPQTPINNNGYIKNNKKQKKNPGYLSQVSHTSDGLTVGYQAHIGHSSDDKSPSSSFQSVSYGGVRGKK